jgi:hypothetical protein
MKNIRLVALLLVSLVVQNARMGAGVSRSKYTEPQSSGRAGAARQAARAFQTRVNDLPARLRQDAQALLATSDPIEKLGLIEALGDSPSDSVSDFFVELLVREPLASVRLELVNYLTRDPRPELRRVFEGLAKSDPDADVAVAALEGVRAVDVLEVRAILTQRLEQSRSDGRAFKTFVEADERWISLVRGTMLPAFMRVPPPRFSTNQQDRVRVVALGDFGTGTNEQRQVAAAMRTHHLQSAFDIGVTVGDNFYVDGMKSPGDPRWQTWWEELYGPLQIMFYAVLGNHDWHLFDSPAAEILYSEGSRSWHMPAPYYTFVAGPVQFFALDTNEISQKQLRWLDDELTRSQSRWKVVYGHHQIYSDGYHGDTSRLVTQLFPLLKNRVDVYLSGHEHDLQHLRPENGVHFLISGGGGRSLRPVQPSPRALFAREEHGFTILEATPTQLDIQFVGSNSQVIHEYKLRK